MKNRIAYTLWLFLLLFSGCIGTDLVDKPIGPELAMLSIEPEQASIQAGQSLKPTVSFLDVSGETATPTLEWASSDETIATISDSGEINAIKSGQCIISATELSTDLEAELFLTVVTDPFTLAEISLFVEDTVLSPGAQLQITAEGRNLNGDLVTISPQSWSSTEEDVLTVDSNGLATAIAPGSTEIVLTSGEIKSAPLTLTVAGDQRSGTFEGSNGYSVSGTVVISESAVELQSDFNTSSGPGLYLYLSNSSSNVDGGVSLGALNGNSGEQTYELPAGTSPDDFNYVIVHCQPFNVVFGFAELN